MLVEVPPRIGFACQPFPDPPRIPPVRLRLAQLGPVERGRHRRTRACPQGVRRDERLRVPVAVGVQEDPVTTLVLALFGGQPAGIADVETVKELEVEHPTGFFTVEMEVAVDGDNVIPTITGTAFVVAELELIFDPRDPFRGGITA